MNDLKYVVDSSLKDVKLSKELQGKILEQCRQEKREPFKSKRIGRYAGIVAACFILCIGGTVAAKKILWDDYVAESYGVSDDEALQEKTMDSGLVTDMETVAKNQGDITSVTCNGITVEVLQTVATGTFLDIYLKIEADNEDTAQKLYDTNPNFDVTFENSMFGSSEGGMVNKYTGEGMKTAICGNGNTLKCEKWLQEEAGYEIYNIHANVIGDKNFDGDRITLSIQDFIGNSQTSPDKVVEGEWELTWNIQASHEERRVVLDKEYTNYGKQFKVHQIILNETGSSIYLDRTALDAEKLLEANVYMETTGEEDSPLADGVPGFEYKTMEWAGINGIPMEIYKNLTDAELVTIIEQMGNGEYEGEYIDLFEWCEGENRIVVSPWEPVIVYKDGTIFQPNNSTGITYDTDEYYVINTNYIDYLEIEEIAEIWIGNCRIPLSDGVEE